MYRGPGGRAFYPARADLDHEHGSALPCPIVASACGAREAGGPAAPARFRVRQGAHQSRRRLGCAECLGLVHDAYPSNRLSTYRPVPGLYLWTDASTGLHIGQCRGARGLGLARLLARLQRCASSGVRRVGFYESHALSRKHSGGVVHRIRMRFFRSLDAIVVPGIAARDALIADGIESSRIWTGFNAVDVAGIAAGASQARAAVREAGHPSRPGLRVLYVGQLIARKNVQALLSAMTGLSDARLTIVGVGEDRAALEESAASSASGRHLTDRLPTPSFLRCLPDTMCWSYRPWRRCGGWS